MLTTLKPNIEKRLQPVAHALRYTDPNVISLFGLLFPVLFFVFVLKEWYFVALFVFIFNAVDLLDGMVARAQRKVTAFGGFLDSTIDRFADFTILAALGFGNLVSWEVLLPLIMLTYLISYIRSRTELAAKGKLTASVGLIERTERLLAIFAGLLLYASWPSVLIFGENIMTVTCVILLVLSAITVGQRIKFAYEKLD